MEPGASIEIRLEWVGKRRAGSNWALFHSRDAVKPWSKFLKNAMPVQSSAFFRSSDFIVDSHLYSIAPVRFNRWLRKLTIDQHDDHLIPIRTYLSAADREVVGSDDSRIRITCVWVVATGRKLTPREFKR